MLSYAEKATEQIESAQVESKLPEGVIKAIASVSFVRGT